MTDYAEEQRLHEEIADLTAKLQDAEAQLKGRHDYGPASPAEQEAAWKAYCARSGWEPDSHPAAKNAYVEGYCDGDSYSEGDETIGLLRAKLQATERLLVRVSDKLATTIEAIHQCDISRDNEIWLVRLLREALAEIERASGPNRFSVDE